MIAELVFLWIALKIIQQIVQGIVVVVQIKMNVLYVMKTLIMIVFKIVLAFGVVMLNKMIVVSVS